MKLAEKVLKLTEAKFDKEIELVFPDDLETAENTLGGKVKYTSGNDKIAVSSKDLDKALKLLKDNNVKVLKVIDY
jgi:hypothetical protein